MRYIITLVHGTFATHAAWTQAGSRCREHLQQALGGEVFFHTLPPILIVRSPADEASTALGMAQLVSWLSVWGVRASTALAAYPLRVLGRVPDEIWPWVVLIVPSVVLPLVTFAPEPVASAVRSTTFLQLGMGACMPSVVIALFVALLTALQILTLRAFGADIAYRGALLEISAETVPPGEWIVHQLTPTDDPTFRHSRSYNDPRALKGAPARHPWVSPAEAPGGSSGAKAGAEERI